MPRSKVTSESYLRELPYRIVHDLAKQLDHPTGLDRNWKGVASRVPSRRGGERYDLGMINVFEMELQKGRSPTMALINDWGTSNATVQDLVNILEEMDMFSSIDVLLPEYNKSKSPEEQVFHEGDTYTSFNRHEDLLAEAPSHQSPSHQSPSHQSPSYMPTKPYNATASWCGHEDVSSSSDSRQPCESSIDPMEQSSLPPFPQENDKAIEYKYRDLYEMTDQFNDKPELEGGCKLGEGGFGMVYKGVFSGGEPCAVKRLKQVCVLSNEKMIKQFTVEHTTLSKLQHDNLVRLYGYSFDGASLCLVFEYLSNGSLTGRLACENDAEPLPWRTRVIIAQGAAQGICHLHKNDHVHRDIKSANILLDENLRAKIGDFGLVRALPSSIDGKTSVTTTSVIGSQVYMAPEAQYGQISPKIDAYSFGVVLLELMTGWPVINDEWENPDIKTHMEYITEGTDFIKFMDRKMEHNFGEVSVRKMYEIATKLLEDAKQKRAALSTVLDDIMAL